MIPKYKIDTITLTHATHQDNLEYHHYKNQVKKMFPVKDYYHLFPGSDMQMLKDPALLPDALLTLIKDKKMGLVIDYCRECHWNIIDLIYAYFITDKGIPPEQITLLCASVDHKEYLDKISKEYEMGKINILYSSYFEMIAKSLYIDKISGDVLSPLSSKHFTKKYINLNRRWKTHRLAMLALLHQQGLLNQGYNSFPLISECVAQAPPKRKQYIKAFFLETKDNIVSQDMDDNQLYEILFNNTLADYPHIEDLLTKGKSVQQTLPLKVDTDNFARDERKHMAYSDQKSLFKFARNSYFTIVTESNFNSDTARLITEKTYKPMFYKHPFILLAPPKSLQWLRELGYKTFDPVIDESYDLEQDDSIRLKKILHEANRLCNLSNDELVEFCDKLLPIVNHNFAVLKSKSNHLLQI